MCRSSRRSRQTFILVPVVIIVTLVAGSPGRAIDDNLTKGATNNHVFEAGMWGESIDNLNGGLNLTIPLGPVFKVSPDVSYQLQLSYSSKIWEMTAANLNQRMDSRLTAHGQAGLGFALQLGRRYKHAATPDCEAFEMVFEDQTGAAHPLDVLPSPDGSYLITIGSNKIRRSDGTTLTVSPMVQDKRPSAEWPNCKSGLPPVVDVHTNGYRGEYVTQIAGKDLDPSTGGPVNWVNIAYASEEKRHHLMSGITDSQGRTIGFTNVTIGGTGLVERVLLPAFGGGPPATYVFAYEQVTLNDLFIATVGNAVYDANHPVPAHNVVLLKSITFPHGYRMEFEYVDRNEYCPNVDPNQSCPDNFGLLQARVLPTGARIEYDYETYTFQHNKCTIKGTPGSCVNPGGGPVPDTCWPSDVTYQGNCSATNYPGTVALREKRVVLDPNQPAYRWTWQRKPYTTVVVSGSIKSLSNPWKVMMRDPYGNDTATRYWAQMGSRDPAVAAQNDNEPWWRNGLVAATDYYRGSSSSPLNLVRTEFQVWEDRTEPYAPFHQGHYKRIKETITIHHDDGGQTARTVHEDWDGYGHYRTTTEFGFDGLPYRIRRTGYNCDTLSGGLCVPRQAHVDPNNWVLDTNSFQETLDPDGQVLQRSEYLFDDLGYLKVQKDLLTIPTTLGWDMTAGNTASGTAGDIITEYCHEGDPNCLGTFVPVRTGNVQSKGIRSFESADAEFSELYTYAHGPYLKTKQIDGITWRSEDKDIDAATGLTAVSRDPNGLQTTFDYDQLGRLTMVSPVSMNGAEQPALLSYPNIHTTDLTQSASPSNFIQSQFSFDALGRLQSVQKRQSNGSLAKQITRYNEAGRMIFQSEWFDPNQIADPNNPAGTTFDYRDPLSDPDNPAEDPFGRVRKAVTGDGKVTRINYQGLSSSVIVEGIKGRCGGDIKGTTSYQRDAFGRLTQVVSARGADIGTCATTARRDGADADYTYDRLDRMTRVRLEGEDPNGVIVAQPRHFTYDALGRRLTETNPESGTMTYQAYDVLGNLLQKKDAAGRVFTYAYDQSSRLTNVYGTGGISLAAMTYDQAGFGYSTGKLTTVQSNDDTGQALIKEERRYNGLNGRLSERSGGFEDGIRPRPLRNSRGSSWATRTIRLAFFPASRIRKTPMWDVRSAICSIPTPTAT